jgi:hypothetical protein
MSPDGTKLAYIDGGDIYVSDLLRETPSRATFGGAVRGPVWAPDGRHIVYSATSGIVWVRSDGVGEPQQLVKAEDYPTPWSFMPDGSRLAYFERGGETGFVLWTMTLDLTDPDHPKPGKPESFLLTPADWCRSFPRTPDGSHWHWHRTLRIASEFAQPQTPPKLLSFYPGPDIAFSIRELHTANATVYTPTAKLNVHVWRVSNSSSSFM